MGSRTVNWKRQAGRWALGLAFGIAGIAPATTGNSSPLEPDAPRRILQALHLLNAVPAGERLLLQAERAFHRTGLRELSGLFAWGRASRTDAVLTRHFDPATGAETRERTVTIFLRQQNTLDELVLDMAHELVHATQRGAWDPYDPSLTIGKYVWESLEGQGGEVEAVMAECQVGTALSRMLSTMDPIRRCEAYFADPQRPTEPQRERVRADFYRVGEARREVLRRLGEAKAQFPLLSADSPRLLSSTGNAPYPLALIREFDELTDIACENSRKRLAAVRQNRSPASAAAPVRTPAPAGARTNDAESVERFLSRRCH